MTFIMRQTSLDCDRELCRGHDEHPHTGSNSYFHSGCPVNALDLNLEDTSNGGRLAVVGCFPKKLRPDDRGMQD